MRKVVGAGKKLLVFQFLGESVFITTFSLLAGLGICIIMLPAFNKYSGMSLSLFDLFRPETIIFGVITLLVVGVGAGVGIGVGPVAGA